MAKSRQKRTNEKVKQKESTAHQVRRKVQKQLASWEEYEDVDTFQKLPKKKSSS